MPRKPISFELDFMIKDIFPLFAVKQFDDVNFNIKPKNQGMPYDTTGMSAKIFVGVNNDMFLQDTDITVSKDNINVLLDKNMLQKSGRAYAEIELTDVAGTITSSSFIFDIDNKIGEGGTIPGEYEGFVAKYERLIAEFRSQVNATTTDCNNKVNSKLSTVDGLVSAKLSDFTAQGDAKIEDVETRFNTLTASQQQSSEVIDARDKEASLKARLDRDLYIDNIPLKVKVADIEGLKESQNLQYATDKGSIVCKETKNGVVKDMVVNGKTLVVNANNEIVSPGTVGAVLKSVGEDADKIEVSSVKQDGNLFDGSLQLGSLGSSGEFVSTNAKKVSNYIQVSSNLKLYTNSEIVCCYDTNKNFITRFVTLSEFTTPTNCKYIRFRTHDIGATYLDNYYVSLIKDDLSIKQIKKLFYTKISKLKNGKSLFSTSWM